MPKEKIIGIKEVYQNLKEITEQAKQGQSFLVVKHSNPVFKITPTDFDKKQNEKDKSREKLWEQIKEMRENVKKKDISQEEIDQIIDEAIENARK